MRPPTAYSTSTYTVATEPSLRFTCWTAAVMCLGSATTESVADARDEPVTSTMPVDLATVCPVGSAPLARAPASAVTPPSVWNSPKEYVVARPRFTSTTRWLYAPCVVRYGSLPS